jgi:hypothetical protein
MKMLLKIVWGFFAVIGILVVGAGLYIWFADPFQLKPLLWPAPAPQLQKGSTGTTTDRNLTPQQEAAVSRFTPETERCAVAALGQARVDEIKAGAQPTPAEIVVASHCMAQ